MRRISLLLILVTAPLLTAFPAIAETSNDNWKIGVLASNSETRVVSGSEYCLMPASMPIRPGNHAVLRNAENLTIGTAEFYDPVEAAQDPERYEQGEVCRLIARFPPIAPRDGLQIVIKPYPRPADRSPAIRVNLDISVMISEPFDWWYDDLGYKRCNPLGDIQFGHNSPAKTTPDSRLSIEWITDEPQFFSNVNRSVEEGEEYCHILASLESPVADEYVIEFGDRPRAAGRD